jgi:alkanesulfonate monooxygenase SsuD/methylene tetrahydromethanopterin reductase-like flavin-dependent oxidoreductase (luciferase family)
MTSTAAPTLGAIVLPQLPPDRLLPAARAADEAGLDELWLWEDCFWTSGIAAASAVLAVSSRLRVGVGLLPVPLRNVALTAMEIATLERLFPGRALIGVGHGVQEWMGQVGARVASPLTLLREYVDALHGLFRGDRLTVSGRYVRLTDVGLDWVPPVPPRVWVGASGPKTLRLAGEVGDGTLLTAATTPEQVTQAIAAIEEGRAAAGRADGLPVVVNLLAATGPGAADRVAAELVRMGETGRPAADLAVAGDAAEVAAAVRRWAGAGATTVLLQPTLDEPDPEGFLRFAAQQVRPLLG